MNKEKYVLCKTISFSHPLSMRFFGRRWYDDDEYEWCDNRTYEAENVYADVYIFEDGSCEITFKDKYTYFVGLCKEKNMMPQTKFSSPKEMVKYFLTDSLFELPTYWQKYMETSHTQVRKYISRELKRHFEFNGFKFNERRGAFATYNKEDLATYGNICPLPEGMRTWGYEYDIWADSHGYVEIGEKCFYDKTKSTYVAYNISDHDVEKCIDIHFNDFNIFNEIDFYKFMKSVDPTLNHSNVYNAYRNSFAHYDEGLTYKDTELDFDKVFSIYVDQMNKKQQEEYDELSKQIAELEAKRNSCYRAFN